MDGGQIAEARKTLASAEGSSGDARRTSLTGLAAQLNGSAMRDVDQAKARKLAAAVAELANSKS